MSSEEEMKKHIKPFMKQALLWLLVCALICAIYILSGQNGAVSHRLSRGMVKKTGIFMELPDIVKHYIMKLDLSYDIVLRKTAHFSLFFSLSVLLYFTIKQYIRKHAKALTIICCMALAGMDEYHQTFIRGRTACITDIIIDTVGSICGLLLVMIFAGIWGASRKTGENSK